MNTWQHFNRCHHFVEVPFQNKVSSDCMLNTSVIIKLLNRTKIQANAQKWEDKCLCWSWRIPTGIQMAWLLLDHQLLFKPDSELKPHNRSNIGTWCDWPTFKHSPRDTILPHHENTHGCSQRQSYTEARHEQCWSSWGLKWSTTQDLKGSESWPTRLNELIWLPNTICQL